MWRLTILTFSLVYAFKCPAQSRNISCAPSSPVALIPETIKLNMWTTPAPGQKFAYAWTVSSGAVQTAGPDSFSWSLKTASPGPQTADGELRAGTTVIARCLVEVQVVSSHAASASAGFLLPGEKEEKAGFHSYLLLAQPSIADSGSGELRRSVIRAWLKLRQEVAELSRVLPADQILSLHIPVTEAPISVPDAEWVLNHYDFARAAGYRRKISPLTEIAIGVVSALQPIGESRPPLLIQDLSQVTPSLAADWVDAFINQAAQERSWSPEKEANLVDELRETLQALAKNAPQIQMPSILKWIWLV